MNVLKRKNPLTESFLIQLDVDLESLGMNKESYKAVFAFDKNNVSLWNPFFSYISSNRYRLDLIGCPNLARRKGVFAMSAAAS